MRLNAVHYDLENWKGITASKCVLFTDIDTSFIPVGRIVKKKAVYRPVWTILIRWGRNMRNKYEVCWYLMR